MKLNRILHLILLLLLTFGLPSLSRAQGNLVNLYAWSNATAQVPNPQMYIPITSSNSCKFIGGFAFVNGNPFPVFVNSVLTTDLTTSPGTIYQISFTMEQLTPIAYTTGGTMSFGSFAADLGSAISSAFYYTNNGYGEEVFATNFDFTAMATSSSTVMSFSLTPDSSGAVALSNLNIVAVPEPSTCTLLALGGITLLFTQPGRRLIQCATRRQFACRAANVATERCDI